MKYLLAVALFCSGGIVALNLAGLVEVNPNHEAAWWKVGLFVFFAIVQGSGLVTDYR